MSKTTFQRACFALSDFHGVAHYDKMLGFRAVPVDDGILSRRAAGGIPPPSPQITEEQTLMADWLHALAFEDLRSDQSLRHMAYRPTGGHLW